MKKYFAMSAVLLPLVPATACTHSHSEKPNIIFILADDMGYGDLSCYGQERFSTPNIDRMAAQGMRFTQHYAGSSVSAPSRSSVITGLTTGHTPIRANRVVGGEGQVPIPGGTSQMFRFLRANGYSTGCFGKWGLGGPGTEGDPMNQCVDEFYGYNCQRAAHAYYPYTLWHNSERVTLEGNAGHGEEQYAPELIHEQAEVFIRKHAQKPFFLWYTTTLPHAELRLPEEEIAPFVGRPSLQPEKVFRGVDDGPRYKNGAYGSQEHAHAAFAAMITYLDKRVGAIMDLLDELGIAEETILIFASDNGPHKEAGADPEFFNSNGPFRGIKRDLYEGGIRVPFIVRWPEVVKPGTETDHVSAFWDLFPTVADVLGEKLEQTDGLSFLPTLSGKGRQQEHHHLYWEFHESGGRQAVRMGKWKAVRYNIRDHGPVELYDLESDPGETNDLSSQYPEKVEEMENLFLTSRTPSDIFEFVF